jgi:hypothetical protein
MCASHPAVRLYSSHHHKRSALVRERGNHLLPAIGHASARRTRLRLQNPLAMRRYRSNAAFAHTVMDPIV